MPTETQFMLTNATNRVWSHSEWAKALFLYKPFGVDQIRRIRDHVFNEAKHGNLAPLRRFFVGTLLVGEVYNLVRDFFRDDEKSLTRYLLGNDQLTARSVAGRALNDFMAGGAFGMLAAWFTG